MRPCFLSLFLLALPLAAHAQADLEGAWTLTFMMDESNTRTMNVVAEVVRDTLHLSIPSDDGGPAFDNVALDDGTLTFDFPSGHGGIACTLYKQDDDAFSGICEGPRGEIPTLLTRDQPKQE